MRFLKGDTTDLLKYARNINSHFANKKCQDVIVAARNLMISEIHNTVKVLGVYCVVCVKQLKFETHAIKQKGVAVAELLEASAAYCELQIRYVLESSCVN